MFEILLFVRMLLAVLLTLLILMLVSRYLFGSDASSSIARGLSEMYINFFDDRLLKWALVVNVVFNLFLGVELLYRHLN